MTYILVAILSPVAWLVLQAFAWSRCRGIWRMVASLPVIVGVGGCLYYSLVQHSNLGPLWFVVIAPFCVGFLLLLCGVHSLVNRYRNDELKGTPES
jgi:hypothetical protein